MVAGVFSTSPGQISGDAGAHSCAGADRAIGALQAATAGNWSGEWFSFGDYQVGRILGSDLTAAPTAPYYWSFNINEQPASAGICQAAVADGDRILFYKACNTALTGCYSGTILRVTGPTSVAPGSPATFSVEQVATTFGPAPDFLPITTRGAAAGVTVSAGGTSAVTGADGNATLTLSPGVQVVRATRGNDVPGQASICVIDGICAPAAIVVPQPKAGAPTVDSPQDGKRYRKRGPRSLKGRFSGKTLRLRLTARPSTRSKRCTTFDAAALRFVRQKRCGATRGKSFEVPVNGEQWSYLLPRAPGRGRYVLDAYGVDGSGKRVLDRAIFYVR